MKKGTFFAIGVLLFWGSFANIAFAGFGITPPYVRNDTLRPGSEYTQEIIIVRSDPVEDLNAELTMNLPGIESWFSSDKGTKFVLPKGASQVKLSITVRVPDDTKLGSYNGNIRIRTSSLQGPTNGVSLALGAQIDVHLKVVDQIFDFSVRRVELSEAESGYKEWWLDFPGKIKFAIYVENTGNIPAAPPLVNFQIYDVSGTQLLETTANTNKITSVLPFDTKKIYAYLPTWLPPGSYQVKYDIRKDETDTAQTGNLSFTILPKGTIPGYEGYGFEGLRLSDQLSLIIPAVILILSITMWSIMRRRRPKSRRPRRVRYEDEDDDDTDDSRYQPPTPRVRPRASTGGGVIDLSRKR